MGLMERNNYKKNSSKLKYTNKTKKLKHENITGHKVTAGLSIQLSINMRRSSVTKDWYFLYVRLGSGRLLSGDDRRVIEVGENRMPKY